MKLSKISFTSSPSAFTAPLRHTGETAYAQLGVNTQSAANSQPTNRTDKPTPRDASRSPLGTYRKSD